MMPLLLQQPLFLFGMLGAAIPVAIHLLLRRRILELDFAAFEFLFASQRRVRGGLTLRRLLILAARVLLLIALSWLFAAPFLRSMSGAGQTQGEQVHESVVLLFDRSLSMQARENGRSRWDLAMDRAERLLSHYGSSDEIIVWGYDRHPIMAEAQSWQSALRELMPGYDRADHTQAVAHAIERLRQATQPARRIILLTDLVGDPESLRGVARLATIDRSIRLQIESIGAKPLENDAITNCRLVAGERADEMRLYVTIAAPFVQKERTVTLTWDGHAGSSQHGFLSITQAGTFEKLLTLDRRELGETGSVQLEGDALEADNHYDLLIPGGGKGSRRVLIVDGDPRSRPRESESFFVERALTPDHSQDHYPLQIIPMRQLALVDPARFDVILLLNPTSIESSIGNRLEHWVKVGGGLLFAAGNQWSAEQYNPWSGRLIPGAVRSERVFSTSPSGRRDGGLAQLTWRDPVLRPLSAVGNTIFQSFEALRVVLVQPDLDRWRLALSLQGNVPLLLASEQGQGRLLFYTSSLDLDWSSFALRPGFVPFIRQLVDWLAQVDDLTDRYLKIGESLKLIDADRSGAMTLERPDGERLQLEPGQQTYGVADTPGIYSLLFDNMRRERYVVGVDPRESDLKPIDHDLLEAIRAAWGADRMSFGKEPRSPDSVTTDFAPALGWVVLGCVVMEIVAMAWEAGLFAMGSLNRPHGKRWVNSLFL